MGVPRRLLASAVAFLLVGSGLLVVAVSHEAADRLVHPPREHATATPATLGLSYADASLRTGDGLRLAAWWIPAAGAEGAAAPTVVFLHGYGASKVQALSVASFLHAGGYNVLAFDFRAHGDSEGSYTTVGLDEVSDVTAALAFLDAEPGVDRARVALFGWSMGAATALNAARGELGVSAMILDSPFATLDDVASNVLQTKTGLPAFPFAPLSFMWASWMVHRQVTDDRPIDHARSVRVPLLIIQGLHDSLVGDHGARALHQAAGKSELWLVPTADHVDAVNADPQEYERHVLAFLAASLAG